MKNQAFSLVELSIVLVILGLLTGGILTGANLIRAAELRSVPVEFQRYQSAIYQFRDKYFYLPGDMPNATDFWGAADGGDGLGSDCHDVDVSTVSNATCNGNGDGDLWAYDGSAAAAAPEFFHAWVQLANAGLVEGSYTGTRTANPRQGEPGINVPQAKIGNAGWSLLSMGLGADGNNPVSAGHAEFFPGNYDQPMLRVGKVNPGYEPGGAILKAEEAWNIDTKVDDGKPAKGKMVVREGDSNCHTNTDPDVSEYALTSTAIDCSPMFLLDKGF